MPVTRSDFGQFPDGRSAHCWTLINRSGMTARVSDYGATLLSLHAPDREGAYVDVVLGKDSLADYLAGHPCFGSTCGRTAGRIGRARFEIDGRVYHLKPDDGGINCLHGGPNGYHTRLWEGASGDASARTSVCFSLSDPGEADGFPGTVDCRVRYALLDDNSLRLDYEATTDQCTPFNVTNHSYFNLAGGGDVLDHLVAIYGAHTAAVDANGTLTGERHPVKTGYNDYQQAVRLRDRDRLEQGNADAHFFLEKGRTHAAEAAARVFDPQSGRIMDVLTTQPGLQFYAGLALGSGQSESGKKGELYQPLSGLCLETQDYPDSINFPDMGRAVLRPGERFQSTTIFRFSTA